MTQVQLDGAVRCIMRGRMQTSGHTTAAVQRYLDALAADAPADPIIRELLARSAGRLEMLCANLLHRGYPRLMRPPVNLQRDELLDAVVERLLRALRTIRPQNVRQFFGLANQHMRWELNDLARRLDEHPAAGAVDVDQVLAPAPSDSRLSPNAVLMLQAIENLPEDERETFSLVRIQGLSNTEAAEILGVATKTIQRRLGRSLVLLSNELATLRPGAPDQTGN